jgi:uncharacterized protein
MKVLDHFDVPYLGLKNGSHTFHFEVEDSFFQEFEGSQIKRGQFKVKLELDKRPDMGIADITCDGSVTIPCDRCLSDFSMPINADLHLHIKYGEVILDNEEVVYISQDTSKVNFAQHIYEIITISLPMIRMHDDVQDCDQDVIKKMHIPVEEEDQEETNRWGALKNLNLDN